MLSIDKIEHYSICDAPDRNSGIAKDYQGLPIIIHVNDQCGAAGSCCCALRLPPSMLRAAVHAPTLVMPWDWRAG